MDKFQQIITNLEPSYRYDTLEGRKHLVAPVSMLVEGVHNGSKGPIFYPNEELGKGINVWDHKPIVVYHPQLNGAPISACDPDILSTRKVGVILRTNFKDGLKAEAWIDEEKANQVDSRVTEAILNNEPMEVSTGLFTDTEEIEGTWNEESYVGVARNYRPDHLALLPDRVGACSLADGAGLMVNAEDLTEGQLQSIGRGVLEFLEESKERKKGHGAIKDYMCSNCFTVYGVSFKAPAPTECGNCEDGHIINVTEELTANQMSFDEIRNAISAKLNERVNDDNYVWIEDIYPTYVIYEYNAFLFVQEYERGDNDVQFVGEPTEVQRVISYVPVANLNSNQEEDEEMEKKDIVEALIKNENVEWTEDDRDALMAMEESELLVKFPIVIPEPVVNEEEEVEEETEEVENEEIEEVEEEQVENQEPITAEAYVQNAPPEIRDMLEDGLETNRRTRSKLIETIMANEANGFSKKFLEAQSSQVLRNLSKLAAPVENKEENEERGARFDGMREVPDNLEDSEEEPLNVPTMSFGDA